MYGLDLGALVAHAISPRRPSRRRLPSGPSSAVTITTSKPVVRARGSRGHRGCGTLEQLLALVVDGQGAVGEHSVAVDEQPRCLRPHISLLPSLCAARRSPVNAPRPRPSPMTSARALEGDVPLVESGVLGVRFCSRSDHDPAPRLHGLLEAGHDLLGGLGVVERVTDVDDVELGDVGEVLAGVRIGRGDLERGVVEEELVNGRGGRRRSGLAFGDQAAEDAHRRSRRRGPYRETDGWG